MINIKSRIRYSASNGSLANAPKVGNVNWYSCREQFHRSHRGGNDFLYSTTYKNNVRRFIKAVEDKVEVPEDQRCELADTDVNAVLYVRPRWWARQRIRLSLFTILLRCGDKYVTDDDFQTALFSKDYTQDTKPAVDRFMNGYTYYVGSRRMWMAAFTVYARNSVDYAERTLVKELRISEKSGEEAEKIISSGKGDAALLKMLVAHALDKAFEEGHKAGKGGAACQITSSN